MWVVAATAMAGVAGLGARELGTAAAPQPEAWEGLGAGETRSENEANSRTAPERGRRRRREGRIAQAGSAAVSELLPVCWCIGWLFPMSKPPVTHRDGPGVGGGGGARGGLRSTVRGGTSSRRRRCCCCCSGRNCFPPSDHSHHPRHSNPRHDGRGSGTRGGQHLQATTRTAVPHN
jgi:hypothetical protein